MAKFKITFEHSERKEYEAIIDAKNEEEAKELFEEDPFNYVEDQDGILIEGFDLKISETEQV